MPRKKQSPKTKKTSKKTQSGSGSQPKSKAKPQSSTLSRSGRFAGGTDAEVTRFTESVSYDWRLWRHDILGSMAHASMLHNIGILTEKEMEQIIKGLQTIGEEIANGTFQWNPELEDVHMNIEAELTRRVPAGAKLHTGRSRNDQIALDTRMWLRDEMVELQRELTELQEALLELADRHLNVILPGYTHLQRAQPVYFAHHLLAYVEMVARDLDRLRDAFQRVNVCPLGSGALAGTTLPLDRNWVAETLGFIDPDENPLVSQNSMDAVSDRDFAVEFCALAALLGVHLSRLAEDIILWSSSEFDFIRIADAYTTGSSLMPQKKNPDIAELTRGKSGRLIGNLVSLLTLLKGLPMTYNRDLQEDKERLFDSMDTSRACVRMMSRLLQHTTVNAEACERAAADPALMATDLADYLVRKGVPFRQAHHAIGTLVARAEELNQALDQLSLGEFQAVHSAFQADVHDLFDPHQALGQRKLTGAPSPKEVRRQITRWRKILSQNST